MVARHRIAVLGGGEIDGVFSDCIEGVIFCILPTGIARLRQGDGRCFARLQDGERHRHILRIAAGAELDSRAALHLRQVLAIDLQIQGLRGDGQSIDDNIVQLRVFDIIPGIPLVGAVRVEHLVSKCCVIQNRFPRRALCQRQFADHGRIFRPGEFRTIVSNDLINAGCGRFFRIAQGGGDIVTFDALDRHCALDGVAVQVKSRVLRAVDGIIAGHVGQQLKGRAAVSVCVKGCLQISKSPPRAVALAIVQGCFSHRGRAAVGAGSGAFVKAVLAAVAARLYHQVAGLGSGFLQRELRVVTVVSKSRFLGKQITQCDAVIQPQIFSQNLSAVQLDFAAPNLQLEQGGAVILRIKYQCTAVPHGHAHRAVAAAAVNDRQFTGANLARGRKAADIQAVSAQTVSVQVQREGLAGICIAGQHRVCQQLDGLTVSCRIQRGRHIGIIGFADAGRKLRPADRALAVFTDGARALGVRVGTGKAAVALVVHHGVGVLLDGYVLQKISPAAVLHCIVLVEGMTRRQQGYRRNREVRGVVVVLKRTKRAAADSDGPAVVMEIYRAERTTLNVQCAVVDPLTLVHCAAGDGNGCAIAYRGVTYRAAADGYSAAVLFAGKFASVKISNPAALNRQ